ncbi:MAG: GFA family protein [Solirubrobacteraceae bacterium]
MDRPALTGSCLCGGVRFQLGELPTTAGYCHCTRCQRRTGTAASASARFDGAKLRVAAGEELIASWQPPHDGAEKLFCSTCGGHLFSRNPRDHSEMSVRLGAIDGDPHVRPSWRQYVAYAAAWEPIPHDGLPRFPQARPRPFR